MLWEYSAQGLAMGAEDPNVGRTLYRLTGSKAGQQRGWVVSQEVKLGARTGEPEALGSFAWLLARVERGQAELTWRPTQPHVQEARVLPTFLLNIPHHGRNITPF